MPVEYGDQQQKPNLHVIESSLPSEPPEVLPQVTPDQIDEYSYDLLKEFIYPEIDRPIRSLAVDFLSAFSVLKGHHANLNRIPNDITLMVQAVTLQSLRQTAQDNLELSFGHISECKRSDNVEGMRLAFAEASKWRRIRMVLETAEILAPQVIFPTTQNPSTS